MRNRYFIKKSLAALLPISMVLGVALLLPKAEPKEAQGYSTSSLPSTIYLKDLESEDIRSYYSDLDNLDSSERQGNNLLKNLKNILKNGQKYYNYDNGSTVWEIYEIADRDWVKSPASSTTYGTYDSTNEKITNYQYGSSKNNPYIHALYINRDVDNQTKAWGNHNQDQWGINREHVWPKAEGFETSGAGGARGDPMHLMAGNGYANNIHSNYYYGYVKTSSSYTDCGTKYSNQSGNLRGTPVNANSGTVFEPQDCDKGDIARAIFYMVARYNYLSGSDSDGINSNNPNLELTQNIGDWSSSGYSSTTSNTGKMGLLTDLLNWHHQDPVDQYEIHRNNLLYRNFTNNRNPFIDFPEWVDFIWGTATYSGKTKQSYSSTPTGYATPSSDTINGYNSGSVDPVAVTGVSLHKNSTSLEVDSSEVLSYEVSPSNATNHGVTWTSSNNNVATVTSSGRVTGVSEGNATITITTSDGNFTDTCTVTVTAKSGGGSGGGEGETSLLYELDTSTSKIPVATANSYGNYTETGSGYNWTITCGSKQTDGLWLGSNSTQKAKMILSNGSYTEATAIASTIGVTGSATYYSALFQKTGGSKLNGVSSVELTYTATGGTAPSEAWVVYSLNNGSTWNVFDHVTTLSSAGTTFEADSKINSDALFGFVIHCSNYCQFKIPILKFYTKTDAPSKVLSSIDLDTSDAKTIFNVGDSFDYEGLSVTANYSDGTDDIVTDYTVSTPDMSSVGTKTVTVTYSESEVEVNKTYEITVSAVVVSSIDVEDPKTSYFVGDTFVKPTVIATFSNGSTSDVTNSATFSGYNLSNSGNQTVSVSYTNGATVNTSYSITVTAVTGTSLVLTGNYKTSYEVGDTFSTAGMVITEYFNNETSETIAASSCTFSGYNMDVPGNYEVTVSYQGLSTTYNISVISSSSSFDTTTVTTTIRSYAESHSWENSKQYLTISLDENITFTASGNSNTGKYYTNGYDWRFYQTESAKLIVTSTANTFIKSITLTFNPGSNGTLSFNSNSITSGTALSLNAQYASFDISASSGTSGQIKFTSLEVVYETITSSPTSLLVTNPKTDFKVGDDFACDGTIIASFENGETANVSYYSSYTGYNLNAPGNQSVIVTYMGVSTSYNITVSYPTISSNSYILVKNTDNLRIDDEIIFVGINNSTYYDPKTLGNNVNYLSAEEASKNGLILTSSNNSTSFKIGKDSGNFTFYDTSASKYLATSSSGLTYSTSSSNATNFSLTINSETGAITTNNSSYSYKYLDFNYNSGTPRFRFATTINSSASYRVYIYKKASQIYADYWAQTFLDSTSNGTTCNVNNWSTLASLYNDLPTNAKNELINVEANASTEYSIRAQAMARYDFFMSDARFNQGTHFITGRVSSSSLNPLLALFNNEKSSLLIFISLTTIVSTSLVCGYFFIRRKKEQN